ncbi:hypothetical protein FDH97_gp140 [Erwinia phage vB_EamM_Deimos-Minion]|uniref:Uncharacterized protein n=1 Tax=Erwinia phage vB_EamM_Deimos-Minion TaxID=1815986 RepID=A0A173GFK8_9CAUD|nr:hypothetical protein FDH97_gp140 [Erwinia phage vB_EamM_Deimos-Minion]ANH52238.1 hypothetical protein DM_140 [Erwinia phage vB_EamM_Deimos-Minion]
MSSKKAAKVNPKKQHKQAVAQQTQQVNGDLEWARGIFSHIDSYFVQQVNNLVHRRYKGSDNYPKHFGARVEINEKHGRYDILKFLSWDEAGVLDDFGNQTGEFELGYVHFHRLKEISQDAHKNNRPVDIGWAYVPHVDFEHSVDAAMKAAAKHDHFEAAVRAHLQGALDVYATLVDELKAEYQPENADGQYVGVCFYFNPETNVLEYVMQKHGVTDLIDGKASERDFRDLPAGAEVTGPIVVDGDTDFRNYNSCMLRLVSEVARWERISKPNKECMETAATDLVGRMITNAEAAFEKAKEKAAAEGITADLSLRYNGLRGLLEVVYKDELGNTALVDIGMDAAAVLLIMTRIEPDLQMYVTPRFNKAFVERFGAGDQHVKNDNGDVIATEVPARGLTADFLAFDELAVTSQASPVQELDDAFDKDDEPAADENYALKA